MKTSHLYIQALCNSHVFQHPKPRETRWPNVAWHNPIYERIRWGVKSRVLLIYADTNSQKTLGSQMESRLKPLLFCFQVSKISTKVYLPIQRDAYTD